MDRYNVMNYFTKSVIGFGLVWSYDVFVNDRDGKGFALYDGGSFFLSTIIAEYLVDLVGSFLPIVEGSIQGILLKPVVNGLVYMYIYNYFVRPNFEGNNDNSMNFLMASLSELIIGYLNNPLSSLFGVKNVY